MSNVTLAIGGRSFTVACGAGEEGHVAALGRLIDDRVTASGAMAQNETRMLLFAALMLADEAHEAREALSRAQTDDARLQARVESISHRLEALASHLEDTAANP